MTDLQKDLLGFLRKHPEATVPDIMAEFGFKSRNAVYHHVRKLEKAKMLKRPVVKRSGWIVSRLSTP